MNDNLRYQGKRRSYVSIDPPHLPLHPPHFRLRPRRLPLRPRRLRLRRLRDGGGASDPAVQVCEGGRGAFARGGVVGLRGKGPLAHPLRL